MTDELDRTQPQESVPAADVAAQTPVEDASDLVQKADTDVAVSDQLDPEEELQQEEHLAGDDISSPEPSAEPEAVDDPTDPMPVATQPMPQPVEAPRPTSPSPSVDAPRLSDVGATLVQWARGRMQAAGAFLATHRAAACAVALACIGAALCMALFGMRAAQTPSNEQIMADAQTSLAAPSHTTSSFESGDPLVLESVEVGRKKASDTRRDACDVEVRAVFANSAMESTADAQLTYVRAGNDWELATATVGKASHRALSGVSPQQVKAHIGELLEAADSTADPTDESLAKIYRTATAEIARQDFDEDAQTDTLDIHCTSEGTFVSYECDLTARFRFVAASGAWELAEVTASSDARELGFGPLVGTWHGTFTRQESTKGKCLAASDGGLTVVVEHAEMTGSGKARIEGTVSGIAHLHADLDEDATSTEGDFALDGAAFSGTLATGDEDLDVVSLLAGNNPKHDIAGIEFDCTVRDLAEGRARLTLTFGQSDAPDAATATLASTHTYQDYFLLLMPYEREARFVDHFSLVKAS